MARLLDFLPRRTYAVAASLSEGGMRALIAGAELGEDDRIRLRFPKANPFAAGELITLHLDNRTGVESFTSDLLVYRCSYKGRVLHSKGEALLVEPLEYKLIYSSSLAADFMAPGYSHPQDERAEIELPESPLRKLIIPDEGERENKLGVWITRAVDRPHTTVMAFLSSQEDDIFLISHRGTYKSHNIHRDGRCLFAIDHRASYHFERAIDWNYSILKAEAFVISRDRPLFSELQRLFVDKNPWERLFFTDPKVEMFHLRPLEILCPEKFMRRRG